MAWRRASLASLAFLRSTASIRPLVAGSAVSVSLHAGQRLAKPGLSGLSSNSSEQTAQTLIGNGILLLMITQGSNASLEGNCHPWQARAPIRQAQGRLCAPHFFLSRSLIRIVGFGISPGGSDASITA